MINMYDRTKSKLQKVNFVTGEVDTSKKMIVDANNTFLKKQLTQKDCCLISASVLE